VLDTAIQTAAQPVFGMIESFQDGAKGRHGESSLWPGQGGNVTKA